jgi:diacylglycerol kinase family enzyme
MWCGSIYRRSASLATRERNEGAPAVSTKTEMSIAQTDPLTRLETLLGLEDDSTPSRRMLVIVNPYATTVSDRLRNLVVYALRGRYEVRAVDTEARGHATELCREAAQEGYDVVVAFGGDGTVNEAANGLVGSDTPLCCLPGGRTNVYCRMLGIPTDVVDATEHLLGLAHDWQPRQVDVGKVNERYFLFSAGVGLDASVVERVEDHPRLKARVGEYYYAWTATHTVHRHYMVHPPRLEAELGDETVPGVTAIVQNAEPYTYFGNRPVHMGEGATLGSGDLAGVVLQRAWPIDIPTITWRALSKWARLVNHRQVHGFAGLESLRVRSADERPLPLQVDGDYIGAVAEADFSVQPGGMLVVA